MKSNNNLAKRVSDGGNGPWDFHIQVLERANHGGSNAFDTVSSGDTRVAGTVTGVTEIESVQVGGDYQECVFPFALTDTFPLVAGRTYAFVGRQVLMNGDSGFSPGVNSKSHTLGITYIIAWDETTADSTFGGWLPN